MAVKGLKKSFGGARILNDLSIELNEGEVVLLRGDNGAGKTTLLNILSGNLEPDEGVISIALGKARERFQFPMPWWAKLNPFNHFTPELIAQEGVGRTWQDVRLFSTFSVTDNVLVAAPKQKGENPMLSLFARRIVRKQEQDNLKHSRELIDRVGLLSKSDFAAAQLSLGQTKRTAIARCVNGGARILFLDEPLAGLDAEGMKSILELLREIASEHKITLVIVEHVFNIPYILDIATAVWTLKDGKILRESVEPLKEDAKNKTLDFRELIDDLARRAGTIPVDRAIHGALTTTIRVKEGPEVKALEIKNMVVDRDGRTIVGKQNLDGMDKGFSLTVNKGEIVILQAPNGWGKTTLLEAAAGLIPAASGMVKVSGEMVSNCEPWVRTNKGLCFLQSRDNCFTALTVHENFKLTKKSVPPELASYAGRTVSSLSGGERQRVAFNTAVGEGTWSIALLDEPFSALDPIGVMTITEWLLQQARNTGVLIAVPATALRESTECKETLALSTEQHVWLSPGSL